MNITTYLEKQQEKSKARRQIEKKISKSKKVFIKIHI